MRIIKKREVRKAGKGDHLVYRIYYGDEVVYVGRTSQPLSDRLRGHFFKKKRYILIDINQVTKIDYSVYKTVADMYLYEIYWINILHPRLNRNDRAADNLTVSLPNVRWMSYQPRLFEKWKQDINEQRAKAGKKEVLYPKVPYTDTVVEDE